jgi:hypothetical protein
MNGVTSVKRGLKEPPRSLPIALLFIGAGIMFVHKGLGYLLLAIAILWLAMQRDKHTIMLNSASGESQALTSTDKEYIQSIINALNEAIIHRG